MQRNRIVMVYPQQGFSGTYVKHMPLSLLYASIDTVKSGFEVKILDTRFIADWRARLRRLLDEDTVCVGISVMSGSPIRHAIEIGRVVKSVDPRIPVVWGGPHATFSPATIIEGEWSADYALGGYAVASFGELCRRLRDGHAVTGIEGLSYRLGDRHVIAPSAQKALEFVDYRDIPYHLIEDYSPYGQLDQDVNIFPMYSSMGCPYLCSFCSSPAQYSTIEGRRWVPLAATDVVDHIEHVIETYGANYIYFIDDDSFPKLSHVESIIDEIQRRGLNIKLGFRGARINEIKRMSDAFLDKLAAAGTNIMHIGAESGSDRILKLLNKDSSREDIIACNRKLARHPSITAGYNIMMGIPTETCEDLAHTRDLMMQLVEEHPNCVIFPPNKFRPLPGTALYRLAETEWNYTMPDTLQAWADIESEADISRQWYTDDMRRFCNLLLIGSYFIDNKIARFTEGRRLFFRAMRLINRLYRPIALFRLRHGLSRFLVEYTLYRIMTRLFARLQSRLGGANLPN